LLVQVPGEVERILGPAVGPVQTPAWWVEIRATARDGARELAGMYADTLIAMVLGSNGAADGTYLPRFVGMGCPIGVGVGNEAVRASSVAKLLAVDGISNAMAIGPVHEPAIWYPIGTGRQPKEWEKYASVMKKLLPGQNGSAQG
jgi:hypothetical protein